MVEVITLVDKKNNEALVERGSEAEATLKKMGFAEPVFKAKRAGKKDTSGSEKG